jgi:hypothetical protein
MSAWGGEELPFLIGYWLIQKDYMQTVASGQLLVASKIRSH